MLKRFVIVALLVLSACGRPLSTGETAFANSLFGSELATQKVRVAAFPALTSLTQRRPPRPRVACRERIWPEPEQTDGMVQTFTAAFVSWNRINMADMLYMPDYMGKYPEKMSLAAAMLIGHELTHVWQWQNRNRTGYTPLKAAQEHHPGEDPYLLDLDAKPHFLDFPFEQQGAIVEEYICCRALDPQGGRTKRLHAMLAETFPVTAIRAESRWPQAVTPDKNLKPRGICS